MKRLFPWSLLLAAIFVATIATACCGSGKDEAPADPGPTEPPPAGEMTAPTETPKTPEAPRTRAGMLIQDAKEAGAKVEAREGDLDKMLEGSKGP